MWKFVTIKKLNKFGGEHTHIKMENEIMMKEGIRMRKQTQFLIKERKNTVSIQKQLENQSLFLNTNRKIVNFFLSTNLNADNFGLKSQVIRFQQNQRKSKAKQVVVG